MSKLRDILRGIVPDIYGDFGVEIECEGTGINIVNSKYWKTEPDASLRGTYGETCAEYVSKLTILPTGIKQSLVRTEAKIHPALKTLFSVHLKNAVFASSPRTSTHVHVNILDLTRKELFNYIYILTILEDSLLKLSGKSRLGNRFCLSSKEAIGYFDGVAKLFSELNTTLRLNIDDFKYSVINIATVGKYGSLEIRCMEGSSDPVRLTRWINLLLSLRDLAKTYKNPHHVMEDFQNFNECKIQSVIRKFPELLSTDIQNNILYSISYCCDFPQYYKEFTILDKKSYKFGDIIPEHFINPENLNRILQGERVEF